MSKEGGVTLAECNRNDKQEVIEFFCALTTHVGGKIEHGQNAHDCFCGMNPMFEKAFTFSVNKRVLDFITKAVDEKLLQETDDE
tara:strand:- start:562 stop:813 length:252 start_codon:yes stop_codon:yes gene_type:complete